MNLLCYLAFLFYILVSFSIIKIKTDGISDILTDSLPSDPPTYEQSPSKLARLGRQGLVRQNQDRSPIIENGQFRRQGQGNRSPNMNMQADTNQELSLRQFQAQDGIGSSQGGKARSQSRNPMRPINNGALVGPLERISNSPDQYQMIITEGIEVNTPLFNLSQMGIINGNQNSAYISPISLLELDKVSGVVRLRQRLNRTSICFNSNMCSICKRSFYIFSNGVQVQLQVYIREADNVPLRFFQQFLQIEVPENTQVSVEIPFPQEPNCQQRDQYYIMIETNETSNTIFQVLNRNQVYTRLSPVSALGSHPESYFLLNITKPLDYETKSIYIFSVIACRQDRVTTALCGYLNVTMRVTNENEHAPTLDHSVPTDIKVREIVIPLDSQYTDPNAADLLYLELPPPLPPIVVSDITSDYANYQGDGNSDLTPTQRPAQEASVIVRLSAVDRDMTPEEQSRIRYRVEGTPRCLVDPVPLPAVCDNRVDFDPRPSRHYKTRALSKSTSQPDFTIETDERTQENRLVGYSLDYEQCLRYSVRVSISDTPANIASATMISTAVFNVSLEDSNDNPPCIQVHSNPPMQISVKEEMPAPYQIPLVSIEAADPDMGAPGDIKCMAFARPIEAKNVFGPWDDSVIALTPSQSNPPQPPNNRFAEVKSIRYNVNITSMLDRELYSSYQVIVSCYDGPLGLEAFDGLHDKLQNLLAEEAQFPEFASFSFAVLVLVIRDVNDNSPKFDHESYSFFLDENLSGDSLVGQVRAFDSDQENSNNSDIDYSILNDARFRIDNQGKIYAIPSFDAETTMSTVEFTVQATDRGTPTRSGNTIVTVTINDKNDNAARLNSRVLNAPPMKYYLGQLNASDADRTPANNNVTFALPGDVSTPYPCQVDNQARINQQKCRSLINVLPNGKVFLKDPAPLQEMGQRPQLGCIVLLKDGNDANTKCEHFQVAFGDLREQSISIISPAVSSIQLQCPTSPDRRLRLHNGSFFYLVARFPSRSEYSQAIFSVIPHVPPGREQSSLDFQQFEINSNNDNMGQQQWVLSLKPQTQCILGQSLPLIIRAELDPKDPVRLQAQVSNDDRRSGFWSSQEEGNAPDFVLPGILKIEITYALPLSGSAGGVGQRDGQLPGGGLSQFAGAVGMGADSSTSTSSNFLLVGIELWVLMIAALIMFIILVVLVTLVVRKLYFPPQAEHGARNTPKYMASQPSPHSPSLNENPAILESSSNTLNNNNRDPSNNFSNEIGSHESGIGCNDPSEIHSRHPSMPDTPISPEAVFYPSPSLKAQLHNIRINDQGRSTSRQPSQLPLQYQHQQMLAHNHPQHMQTQSDVSIRTRSPPLPSRSPAPHPPLSPISDMSPLAPMAPVTPVTPIEPYSYTPHVPTLLFGASAMPPVSGFMQPDGQMQLQMQMQERGITPQLVQMRNANANIFTGYNPNIQGLHSNIGTPQPIFVVGSDGRLMNMNVNMNLGSGTGTSSLGVGMGSGHVPSEFAASVQNSAESSVKAQSSRAAKKGTEAKAIAKDNIDTPWSNSRVNESMRSRGPAPGSQLRKHDQNCECDECEIKQGLLADTRIKSNQAPSSKPQPPPQATKQRAALEERDADAPYISQGQMLTCTEEDDVFFPEPNAPANSGPASKTPRQPEASKSGAPGAPHRIQSTTDKHKYYTLKETLPSFSHTLRKGEYQRAQPPSELDPELEMGEQRPKDTEDPFEEQLELLDSVSQQQIPFATEGPAQIQRLDDKGQGQEAGVAAGTEGTQGPPKAAVKKNASKRIKREKDAQGPALLSQPGQHTTLPGRRSAVPANLGSQLSQPSYHTLDPRRMPQLYHASSICPCGVTQAHVHPNPMNQLNPLFITSGWPNYPQPIGAQISQAQNFQGAPVESTPIVHQRQQSALGNERAQSNTKHLERRDMSRTPASFADPSNLAFQRQNISLVQSFVPTQPYPNNYQVYAPYGQYGVPPHIVTPQGTLPGPSSMFPRPYAPTFLPQQVLPIANTIQFRPIEPRLSEEPSPGLQDSPVGQPLLEQGQQVSQSHQMYSGSGPSNTYSEQPNTELYKIYHDMDRNGSRSAARALGERDPKTDSLSPEGTENRSARSTAKNQSQTISDRSLRGAQSVETTNRVTPLHERGTSTPAHARTHSNLQGSDSPARLSNNVSNASPEIEQAGGFEQRWAPHQMPSSGATENHSLADRARPVTRGVAVPMESLGTVPNASPQRPRKLKEAQCTVSFV